MSDRPPEHVATEIPPSARFAVIASRFNSDIAAELLRGCVDRLAELGLGGDRVEVHRVPGAFELPVAAQWAAGSGRFSAVICLGVVIRGETPHFDYVAGEAARGIQQVALDHSLPVIFGLLTTDTPQQARDRVGGKHGHAGKRAADAAVEMVALAQRMKT
ncbi:MAG: 6,7-dimethyl-8-ribityllumazine synthase [Tepidisphaeraceae bacterium]|jgi:6,7-dimethyl-8-ribityllumazine synthase